jgi:hypothetical protein
MEWTEGEKMKRLSIFAVTILMLCMLCSCAGTESKTMNFPGVSWGDSLEQVESVYGDLTPDATESGVYSAEGEFFGASGKADFMFEVTDDAMYLVRVAVSYAGEQDYDAIFAQIQKAVSFQPKLDSGTASSGRNLSWESTRYADLDQETQEQIQTAITAYGLPDSYISQNLPLTAFMAQSGTDSTAWTQQYIFSGYLQIVDELVE